MDYMSLTLIFLGACIMLYNIIIYYRLLHRIQEKNFAVRLFDSWFSFACLTLMVFFFLGYLAVGSHYFTNRTGNLLVASIFFFGALFVLLVVTMQGELSRMLFCRTEEIVHALVNAVEAKDKYTKGHSDHVWHVSQVFYQHLPGRYKEQIQSTRLLDAAILHDIGKIGIDERVLNKPGPLNEEEWRTIREHPMLGQHILQDTSYSALGEIVARHHERMDGQGYYGLPAEEIPLESRIIAIADTFSALYTDRIYRQRLPFPEAMRIIREAAGTQLDADLVEVFCTIPQEELEATGEKTYGLRGK